MTADIELNFGKPIPKADPGSYPAICVGIEPFQINEGKPDQKTLLRWDFSLDGVEDPDQPGFNVILDGVTSLATGPKSKMRAWVASLTARQLDEKLNLTALRALCTSKPCLLRVEINDDGYSKAADVLPPMRQPAKPPVATDTPLTALPNMAQPEPAIAGRFDGAPTQPAMAPVPDDELGF